MSRQSPVDSPPPERGRRDRIVQALLVVFLSLVVFGLMWGIMGAVLAVPLLAIAKSVCEQFAASQPVSLLIGGRTLRPRREGPMLM